MARIRSLKPEFWDDRKLARSTSRDARMLYMGLWNQADEHCRLNGDEFWIKGRVFPYEDDINIPEITELLAELVGAGRIVRYEVDGDPYIYLPKLSKHNRLEPAKVESRLPAPPADTDTHPDADSSAPRADESEPDADSSALLYVPGSMDQVPGNKGHVVPRAETRGSRLPDEWVPDQSLVDWQRQQGIPDDFARRELPRFRDYWVGTAGAKGRKADWPATWRNWLRRAWDENPPPGNPNGKATTKAQGWLDLGRQLSEGRTA